jgi:hypothetical protein
MTRLICLLATLGLAHASVLAQPLKATLTAVNGSVHVRAAEDQPWLPAKVGMVLDEGAELRTGLRSAVRFTIPPDQTVTIDRLSTLKILQAARDAASGKITTDLGMKYGRTQYKIEEAGVEHESTIRSPGSTLAVRGSEVIHQHDALASYATGEGHLRFFSRLQRESVAFGDSGAAAKVATNQLSPGANARSDATADPKGTHAGRTALEVASTEQLPEVGGEDLRERQELRGIDLGAFASSAFVGVQPNTLNFDLFFFGGTDDLTDVDLAITDPNGVTLSPLLTATPDGRGVHSGNALQTGGIGQESIVFGQLTNNAALHFIPGTYTIQINLVSSESSPIGIAFSAFQNINNTITPLTPAPNPDGMTLLSQPGQSTIQSTITVPLDVD